jgi:hypothetical protein
VEEMKHVLSWPVRAGVLILGMIGLISMSTTDMSGQEQKIRPGVDPEGAFKFGDANNDGFVDKDEFIKIFNASPIGKGGEKTGNFLFNRLDTNSDGKLSLEEFKKIAEGGPGLKDKLGGKFGDKAKGKFPFPKKDAPKNDTPPVIANEKYTAEQINFFEKNIRPVLIKECYSCHSEEAKKEKGGLLVDTKIGLRKGGDSGPAVVPNDARRSLLLKAIKQTDENMKMPPKSKLSDEVVANFEKWVAMGAPDPRDGKAQAHKEIDIEKGREFWAFQMPKKAPIPAVKDTTWAKSDVDRFLLAAMEAKGLKPVGDADQRALIRRVYFDLIGLPPTPEDVETFVKDKSPDALATVIDKLLQSPRFGERWGRHWLDVARFAESSGKASNVNYPHAWRYRDYVIKAFNDDKPYDQFIREQLAGDLISAKNDVEKAEHLIATGFLAIGPKLHNERQPLQFQMDMIDEQIDTTFQAFMGMTVACARCHDHKFDPIPQKDYYAVAGIFRSSETCYGTARLLQSNHPAPLLQLPEGANAPKGQEPLSASRREGMEKQIKEFRETLSKVNGMNGILEPQNFRALIQSQQLQATLNMYEADGTPKTQAMGVRERFRVMDTPLFGRGEIDKPGEIVRRGVPQVLTSAPIQIRSGSGRKELADWMASKNNPLTARVMVNRVWHHLFGQGIVTSPDNFGTTGQKPSNQALLDTLAINFTENGWSVKKLIRSLMLTHAYQLASLNDAKNYEVDPENVYVWRMSSRRLEAEAIRDAMLMISGQLDLAPAKGSPIAIAGDAPALGFPRFRPAGQPTDDVHRAVYMPIVREQLPESLTLFDFPDPNAVAGERAVTNVPAQALYLMNNPFVIKQAEAAAEKLRESTGDDNTKIRRAYETFYGRPPSDKEATLAKDFITQYSKKSTTKNAWTAFAQALFASAEFANLR